MEKESNYPSPSVLVVDDNVKNLQVLGGFLQNEGMLVEFALDGLSALDWVLKKKFDLVLLDIMMPGIDGYEVCSRIKENLVLKEIPVIFLTAKTDSDSIVKGFECGAVDYVTKPFIRSELLARVHTQIEIKRSKDKLRQNFLEIEERNRSITESIEYAKHIQKTIITKSKTRGKLLPEYFVLFLPKDIVSGDFYWFCKSGDTVVLAVMDCTGHGVPGALMSILGITLLNEIVLNKKTLSPDIILQHLRNELICSMSQKAGPSTIKDGIEGGIISYNMESKTALFSGSFNPLIHIHKNKIREIKAARFPIGYYETMKDFVCEEIRIEKNDTIYMFTDGYNDQFGGPDKKKFSRKRLIELLHKTHAQPMDLQKKTLSDTFCTWKGELTQTDDVLVAGFRF